MRKPKAQAKPQPHRKPRNRLHSPARQPLPASVSADGAADDLLTPREVAMILRCAEFTLDAWRAKGTGPVFMKVGRHIRYRRGDLHAWLAASRVEPAGAA